MLSSPPTGVWWISLFGYHNYSEVREYVSLVAAFVLYMHATTLLRRSCCPLLRLSGRIILMGSGTRISLRLIKGLKVKRPNVEDCKY
jgi:hypothetical protein